ncbi:MAG: hypothetical protein H6594_04265 [Flavobacteriales bacterium]|nr:hypothetical protein [Flavobacteriales bacterium]
MNVKKLLGLLCWLLAFTLPFQYAMLSPDEITQPDGTPNNTVGLISFVAMLALVFIGYALVDSSGSKAPQGH